jgi:hypothetical protein
MTQIRLILVIAKPQELHPSMMIAGGGRPGPGFESGLGARLIDSGTKQRRSSQFTKLAKAVGPKMLEEQES